LFLLVTACPFFVYSFGRGHFCITFFPVVMHLFVHRRHEASATGAVIAIGGAVIVRSGSRASSVPAEQSGEPELAIMVGGVHLGSWLPASSD
jgi:hypothetical protein